MKIDVANPPQDFLVGLGFLYNPGQNHVGFIYRGLGGEIKICDLCWHRHLRNAPFNDTAYMVCSVTLEPVNLKYLAAALDDISSFNSATIPYGIRAPVQSFNSQNQYIGCVAGEGLTCATFVLAVFRENGFKVLDEESWELNEADTQWQTNIVNALRSYFGMTDPVHISEMETMIGQVSRFRPEHVFASGIVEFEKWPINYQDANEMADSILQMLGKAG